MNKIESAARFGAKLVASGSVQTIIGGAVAAVMPPQFGLVCKVVTWVGSTVVAAYIGSKMDAFVDEKVDEAKLVMEEIKDNINTIKDTNKPKEETGG